MKHLAIISLAFLLLSSCTKSTRETAEEFSTQETYKHVIDLLIEQSDSEEIEFHNLYGKLQKIASDSTEKLVVAEYLKTKGFKVTNWSRGNHQYGPRMVSLKLKKDNCTCEVNKYYYSFDKTSANYIATERIKCYKE